MRGIETVRLIGPHGVSVSLVAHIARSLDAKVWSEIGVMYLSTLVTSNDKSLQKPVKIGEMMIAVKLILV